MVVAEPRLGYINCMKTPPCHADCGNIVVSRQRIARRVAGLAAELAAEYGRTEIMIVPVLTGSFIFLADLIRHLPMKMQVDIVAVSSYPGRSTKSRGVSILLPGTLPLAGRHVLIVDDILESGKSIAAIQALLRRRRTASIRTCVLLRKQCAVNKGLSADFIGFDIPDDFVVGYGMDFNHYYRNLPDIRLLIPQRRR